MDLSPALAFPVPQVPSSEALSSFLALARLAAAAHTSPSLQQQHRPPPRTHHEPQGAHAGEEGEGTFCGARTRDSCPLSSSQLCGGSCRRRLCSLALVLTSPTSGVTCHLVAGQRHSVSRCCYELTSACVSHPTKHSHSDTLRAVGFCKHSDSPPCSARLPPGVTTSFASPHYPSDTPAPQRRQASASEQLPVRRELLPSFPIPA